MNMTKKEMLNMARRLLVHAAMERKLGKKEEQQFYIRNAQFWINEVNRRIYQEKLQRQVMMFPKRISFGV